MFECFGRGEAGCRGEGNCGCHFGGRLELLWIIGNSCIAIQYIMEFLQNWLRFFNKIIRVSRLCNAYNIVEAVMSCGLHTCCRRKNGPCHQPSCKANSS